MYKRTLITALLLASTTTSANDCAGGKVTAACAQASHSANVNLFNKNLIAERRAADLALGAALMKEPPGLPWTNGSADAGSGFDDYPLWGGEIKNGVTQERASASIELTESYKNFHELIFGHVRNAQDRLRFSSISTHQAGIFQEQGVHLRLESSGSNSSDTYVDVLFVDDRNITLSHGGNLKDGRVWGVWGRGKKEATPSEPNTPDGQAECTSGDVEESPLYCVEDDATVTAGMEQRSCINGAWGYWFISELPSCK